MKSYGQFCSIARALDLLGERWTLLIVRELLCGSSRFGDLRRGLPRISRTMLAARLRELLDARVIERADPGPRYKLTEAGLELAAAVRELGAWGQRWLPRDLPPEELDADALVWDMQRQVNLEALPSAPVLTRIDFSGKDGRSGTRYLLLRRSEVSLCSVNPGFPEMLRVRAPLRALVGWWRGDFSLADARHAGLMVDGRREWLRAFPGWFRRYAFAAVAPARAGTDFVPPRRRRAG
ncbi:MAG: winged helix-turn-helix transcriptional regulator [Myxococcales bacterium]